MVSVQSLWAALRVIILGQKTVIVICLALLLMSRATLAALELKDSEVKQILEKIWNSGCDSIKLGTFDIIDDMFGTTMNLESGKMSVTQFKFYQAYAKVGVISIQDEKSFQDHMSGRGFNWAYFQQQSGGLRGKIVVNKTPKGEELSKKSGFQREGWLYVKEGNHRIDKVVKNEARQKGADDYRLAMVSYTVDFTPEFKQVQAILGKHFSEKLKIIVLLKFDPFKSEWVRVAWDIANQDEDFKTNNVSSTLSK
jgi:hypothetical protein